eukprot:TRINITY_DN240_c9_g1_i1.p1 TRINITY_DN240_c9_g1~~TRINITY_DN240_c9_g1_i1.p1  ORF type:complete len:746 (-),score=115.38 TRINITY_DN240_c9_g1_i1:406-2643(-)
MFNLRQTFCCIQIDGVHSVPILTVMGLLLAFIFAGVQGAVDGGGGGTNLCESGIFDVLRQHQEVSIFNLGMEFTGVKEEIKGKPVTVLAPIDEAFQQQFDNGTLMGILSQQGIENLIFKSIIEFHILEGPFTLDNFRNLGTGFQLSTVLRNAMLEIQVNNQQVSLRGADGKISTIIGNGVHICNSVVYFVDNILLPVYENFRYRQADQAHNLNQDQARGNQNNNGSISTSIQTQEDLNSLLWQLVENPQQDKIDLSVQDLSNNGEAVLRKADVDGAELTLIEQQQLQPNDLDVMKSLMTFIESRTGGQVQWTPEPEPEIEDLDIELETKSSPVSYSQQFGDFEYELAPQGSPAAGSPKLNPLDLVKSPNFNMFHKEEQEAAPPPDPPSQNGILEWSVDGLMEQFSSSGLVLGSPVPNGDGGSAPAAPVPQSAGATEKLPPPIQEAQDIFSVQSPMQETNAETAREALQDKMLSLLPIQEPSQEDSVGAASDNKQSKIQKEKNESKSDGQTEEVRGKGGQSQSPIQEDFNVQEVIGDSFIAKSPSVENLEVVGVTGSVEDQRTEEADEGNVLAPSGEEASNLKNQLIQDYQKLISSLFSPQQEEEKEQEGKGQEVRVTSKYPEQPPPDLSPPPLSPPPEFPPPSPAPPNPPSPSPPSPSPSPSPPPPSPPPNSPPPSPAPPPPNMPPPPQSFSSSSKLTSTPIPSPSQSSSPITSFTNTSGYVSPAASFSLSLSSALVYQQQLTCT